MDRYEIIELSRVYKRVLEVETTLKYNLFISLMEVYNQKGFSKLLPYLQNILPHQKYKKGKGIHTRDRINDIINSEKTEGEKLQDFLNIAYLSDVLLILTDYKMINNDRAFKSSFYRQALSLDIIKAKASPLNSLRNAIMHFDIYNYKQNKRKWLDTLIFWEKLLACPNMKYIHNLSFDKKPQIAPTLRALADTYPDFLTLSDRLVCDMFDDIAFINGWDINQLPEYWTIGRALYELKKERRST